MEKMFKRSLLGAAIAMTAVAGNANAAIELAGENVVLYGQAAGNLQYWNADGKGKDNNVNVEIESRIGIRGKVSFDAMSPAFIYQMETGNADNGGDGNGDGLGAFGGRDTYVGFEFDGIGQIKYGRQLVAAYDYVDWPHTNPGLGNVFDWHNAIDAGFADRANHTIRFDSANWGGVKVQATLSGMNETTDAVVASAAAGYTGSNFNIHAGYYTQADYKDSAGNKAGDISYAIVGGSLNVGDFTFTAAYKPMWNDLTDNQQDAYSATAQYMVDQTWVYKIGYAATTDVDKAVDRDDNGVFTKDTASQAITGRVMYLLPSTAIYFDVRNYDMLGNDKSADGTRFLFGAEYYF
ncbi:porin [Photobacterium lutimaris]|uniref:Porin n=1 Tax=Photobacterium lutimaris TaxID=388278 RepID=A0A2T3IUR4_9GAMM|nr:porin [Photobacterium lutimaris]PSU32121.1 porin [Photobacterium lutimaris]TDR73781.1 putative porin [Photobacterium lutimaris]